MRVLLRSVPGSSAFSSAIILLFLVSSTVRALGTPLIRSSIAPTLTTTTHFIHPSRTAARTTSMSSSTSAATFRRSMATTLTNPERVQHVDARFLPDGMRRELTKVLVDGSPKQQQPAIGSTDNNITDNESSCQYCVYYWMQRDVRTQDNWALCVAQHVAAQLGQPLRVVYALTPPPPASTTSHDTASTASSNNNSMTLPPALVDLAITRRHADFLLGGLDCVRHKLAKRNIPLHVIMAPSHGTVGQTVYEHLFSQPTTPASVVICDFSPLRQYREWLELQLAPLLRQQREDSSNSNDNSIPLWQVDAHNIVPVWTAAPSRQVGARTLRPKIHNVYQQYMRVLPSDVLLVESSQQDSLSTLPSFDRQQYENYLQIDESVPAVAWAVPGTKAAGVQLQAFINKGLSKFDSLRNDPTLPDICSNLSAWINHGHVSFQRVAKEIQQLNKHANGTASFIEEGVIRRELSDNYLYYTPNDYDSLHGAADWAQASLQLHMPDARDPSYALQELETAQTYDDLWNAAQLQLTREGRMHGFLRMYWAKKILEWTCEGPAVALQTAQFLNDKYALDGRDPNGFVGVGWSIMGIHDMGWKERPIFGKIRYMNYAGCKRKFKVAEFVAKYKGAAENAARALRKQNGGVATSPPTKKQKTLDAFKKRRSR